MGADAARDWPVAGTARPVDRADHVAGLRLSDGPIRQVVAGRCDARRVFRHRAPLAAEPVHFPGAERYAALDGRRVLDAVRLRDLARDQRGAVVLHAHAADATGRAWWRER